MDQAARIVVFTGDGKGKTTAALGMALRAAGHGMRACVIQFIKSAQSGEHLAIRDLANIEIIQSGLGFLPSPRDGAFSSHREAAEAGLQRAAEVIASGVYDLVVLDEICVAVSMGLVEESQVIDLVQQTAASQVIVLTGRGATPGLMNLADTVTEMRCLKHGYSVGRKAQKGVEV